MANDVKHITMLQRSPGYYVSLKRNSPFTRIARAIMPEQMCHNVLRFLFAAQTGKASIVTDHIETFTDKEVVTKSGKKIEADIVITATGLKIRLLGGAQPIIDGKPLKLGEKFVYKGTFLQDVPNAGLLIGCEWRSVLSNEYMLMYAPLSDVNASWTLGSDVSAKHVCKLLNFLDSKGFDAATPTPKHAGIDSRPLMNLKSNYLQRAEDEMPRLAVNSRGGTRRFGSMTFTRFGRRSLITRLSLARLPRRWARKSLFLEARLGSEASL
ncbi:hypothetical protein U1Q18_051443 [Sarracenia purpurea var. burkii]